MPPTAHASVLLQETIDGLALSKDAVVVDATVGGAGHLAAFGRLLGPTGVLVGIDADAAALERARKRVVTSARLELVEGNFRDLTTHLDALGIKEITAVLFDLGWSAFQLEDGRGLSFKEDAPLSMTYGAPGATRLTAEDLVSYAEPEDLATIIRSYGEERYARRIVDAIVAARGSDALKSARALGELIAASVPASYRRGRIHPATKTFQALRIAVNDEYEAITEGLAGAWQHLSPRGRIAVITFHSGEDRIVKNLFREYAGSGGRLITKKPLTPSPEELLENPRARSAKLRLIEKV